MKKRFIIAFAVVLVLGLLIWYKTPIHIADVDPADVGEIVIFDGNTGKKTTITDEGEIKAIIENLNSVRLKRGKVSLGYTGFAFDTTICLKNGKEAGHFIINSADSVRKAPFFYETIEGTINFDYIAGLVRQ